MKIKDLSNRIGFKLTDKNLIKSHKFNKLINQYIVKENIDVKTIPTRKGKRLLF